MPSEELGRRAGDTMVGESKVYGFSTTSSS